MTFSWYARAAMGLAGHTVARAARGAEARSVLERARENMVVSVRVCMGVETRCAKAIQRPLANRVSSPYVSGSGFCFASVPFCQVLLVTQPRALERA